MGTLKGIGNVIRKKFERNKALSLGMKLFELLFFGDRNIENRNFRLEIIVKIYIMYFV